MSLYRSINMSDYSGFISLVKSLWLSHDVNATSLSSDFIIDSNIGITKLSSPSSNIYANVTVHLETIDSRDSITFYNHLLKIAEVAFLHIYTDYHANDQYLHTIALSVVVHILA